MNTLTTHRMSLLHGWLNRLNGSRYLYSIRTAFISTMPLMIAGAFAVVVNQLPIPFYQETMERIFGADWRQLGTLIFNATTQIVALFIVFLISSNLASWYSENRQKQAHGGICGMVGLACYIVMSLPLSGAEGLLFGTTGATGLFVAMLVSLLSSECFIHLSNRKKMLYMLSDDPNVTVPQSFVSVWPAIFVIALFAAARVALSVMGVKDGLPALMNDLLRLPFENTGDTMLTAFLYNFSTHTMWMFGIHGNNVLDGVAQTVLVPAMNENIAAVAAGLAPQNLLTKTLFDAFVYMGGSGTTLALLIALLIHGKGRGARTLIRFAWPNSIFNINEPLVFGIPIVLNPVYAIPFVLTPMVMFITTALAMQLGWVPYTTRDISWATPIFYSGYASTGSFAGVLLQAVNLALAVFIYAPFVKLDVRMAQESFDRAQKNLARYVEREYASSSQKLLSRVDEIGAAARRLGNQVGRAVEAGEVYMLYQPIIDVQNRRTQSVEALLRWKHPQSGFIHPMVTIALAEEIGMIDALGSWIIEQAVAQRKRWTEQGLDDFYVSVNVSALQLNASNFSQQVKAILERHQVPPRQLQIEITETVALTGNEATAQNIRRLSELGVSLAMDDFGVGHSSLLYLRTQPITTLKIDGSLGKDLDKNSANISIISMIYNLCQELEVRTVVEVVDNEKQLETLMSIGPFLIQGYLFSKPLMGDDIPSFIETLPRHPALGSRQPPEDRPAVLAAEAAKRT